MAEQKSQTICLVDSFAQKASIAELTSTSTVTNAIKVMTEQKVSSLPVYDEESNSYLGWVDMRDLAAFVLSMNEDTHGLPLPELKQRAAEEGGKPVTTLCDISTLNPFDPVCLGEPFTKALQKLAAGAHRVPIVSRDTGRIVNIISQSDILTMLDSAYRLMLPSGGSVTIGELRLGYKEVVSVTASSSVAAAFTKLVEAGISALPILSDDGASLLGNVSCSDLADMASRSLFEFGTSSVLQFASAARYAGRPRVVSVSDGDTIGAAIRAMTSNHVHRVYVVSNDDAKALLGVISARDILNHYDWATGDSAPAAAAQAAADESALEGAIAPATSQALDEACSRAMLFAANAGDFAGSGKAPVSVGSGASVQDVLDAMQSAGVSAVAVRAEGEGSSGYAGWVDTRDIAAFVLAVREEAGEEAGAGLVELKRRAGELLASPASQLVNLSGSDAFVAVPEDALTLEVLDALSQGAHRVGVVDGATGELTAVIAQSDVVRFLHAHCSQLGSKLGQSLRQLGLHAKDVASVAADSAPLTAYRKLQANGVSALPVVGDGGAMVTAVSVTDVLPVLTERALEFGTLSLLQYVKSVRDDALPACVTASPDSSLGEALDTLASSGVHRLFVVDAAGAPIGVLSLKDVVQALGQA